MAPNKKSYPAINRWENYSNIINFPLLNLSNWSDFEFAWKDCNKLKYFPPINMPNGTRFNYAWHNCNSLIEFPLINMSNGTEFNRAWYACSNLTKFPLLNLSKGIDFNCCWEGCSTLTEFPNLNFRNAKDFNSAWRGCTSLQHFPPNVFDNLFGEIQHDRFLYCWEECNLTAQSVENILTSIDIASIRVSSMHYKEEITIDTKNNIKLSVKTKNVIKSLNKKGWLVLINDVECVA